MAAASTRVFAVLGEPVAHSLSPVMHNAAFRALGLDAVYVALPVTGGDAVAVARALCRTGGGASVTAPIKGVMAAALDVSSEGVRVTGGCNTVWAQGDCLAGDNTDVAGVLASMRALCVSGGAWLVAGTGGAARAVVVVAAALGARVAVRSRNAARAAAFAAWARGVGVEPAEPAECSVLVNATPLGRAAGDPAPLDAADAPQAVAALDLVYAPGETRWIRSARARGLRAMDGRVMLVEQGMAAWARWFPGVVPPRDIMLAAVRDALR